MYKRTPTSAVSSRKTVLVSLFAAVLMLSGCASSDDADDAAAPLSTEATSTADDTDLDSGEQSGGVVASVLVDTPCWFAVSGLTEGTDLRCGTVDVDARDGSGGVVQLAVTMLGPESSLEPIFHLPGGPGASAEAYAPILRSTYRDLAAATGRMIVIVDQRGSGNSQPFLTCDDPSDPASCATALADAGVDPSAFTTENAADDIADVAAALNATQINVWGASYGSRLAVEVVHRHSDLVRSLVIESVDSGPSPLDDTSDIVAAVERINASCQAGEACGEAIGDVGSALNDVASSLDDAPFETSLGPLDSATFANIVTSLMEQANGTQFAPAFINAVRDGDLSAVDAFVVSFSSQPQVGGPFSPAMNAFVNCSDVAPYGAADVLASGPAVPDDVLSVLLWEKSELLYGPSCGGWPGMSNAAVADRSIATPTLILNGTDDSNTPLENAQLASSQFENATLVAFPGFGHFVVHRGGNACGASILATFVDDPGTAPDTSCVSDAVTPPSLPSVTDVELAQQAFPELGLSALAPVGWLPVGTTGAVTGDGSVVLQIVPQPLEATLDLVGEQYATSIDNVEVRDVNEADWSTLSFADADSQVRIALTDIGGSSLLLAVSGTETPSTIDGLFTEILSSIAPL